MIVERREREVPKGKVFREGGGCHTMPHCPPVCPPPISMSTEAGVPSSVFLPFQEGSACRGSSDVPLQLPGKTGPLQACLYEEKSHACSFCKGKVVEEEEVSWGGL